MNRTRGLLVLLSVAGLVYSTTLMNGFVWDDNVLLVPNEGYRSLDLERLLTTAVNAVEYLPVRDLSYAIDYQIWGMNPFGFHLTNLLVYLLAIAALFYMICRLGSMLGIGHPTRVALITTAVFALHPIQAEVINFVHGRNTLLAGLFGFLSINLFLRWLEAGRWRDVILSALLFLLAVFSKAIAIFIPAFLFILVVVLQPSAISRRRAALAVGTFLVLDALAIWIHLRVATNAAVMTGDKMLFGLSAPLAVAAKAVQIPFFYLRLLLVPYPLSVAYGPDFLSGPIFLRAGLASLVLLGVFVLTFVWLRKGKSSLPALAVIWFGLALFPVLNLLPTSPEVADRYAFFSVLGFALLLAFLVDRWIPRSNLATVLALTVLASWIGIDVIRSSQWRTSESLWRSAIAADPDSIRYNLAAELWWQGRHEEALLELEEDRRRGNAYRYFQYRARLAALNRRLDEARSFYEKSLLSGGDAYKEIHLEMAEAYEAMGDLNSANRKFLDVLRAPSLDPLGAHDRAAREGIQRIRPRLEARLGKLEEDVAQHPDSFRARTQLALALHRIGLYERAGDQYSAALKLKPDSWEAWHNLALTLEERGRFREAIESFEESLRFNPANKSALNHLGICHRKLGDLTAAVEDHRRALLVDPEFLEAQFNMCRALFAMGEPEATRDCLQRARDLAAGDEALLARITEYEIRLPR